MVRLHKNAFPKRTLSTVASLESGCLAAKRIESLEPRVSQNRLF